MLSDSKKASIPIPAAAESNRTNILIMYNCSPNNLHQIKCRLLHSVLYAIMTQYSVVYEGDVSV